MNPLKISHELRNNYIRLLETTFSPRNDQLNQEFRHAVERENFLVREPFVSVAQPFERTGPITELSPETRARIGAIAENPYRHQAEACRRILQLQPTVVATGTGSGKTEAFLMPIIDHCLRHRNEQGLKAILIYPMNALAADQRNRIRTLLRDSNVSFGVYTGDTRLNAPRPDGIPAEERYTRTEFRTAPPDILLTNYQMLEYMLIRGDGRDIFRNHHVQFIVLDEVHSYHGALGTDVASLLRRLRASLELSHPAQSAPVFIGTSATLQTGGTGDPRVGVARFFSQLTAQEIPPEGVVMEYLQTVERPANARLGPPPHLSQEHIASLNPDDDATVHGLATMLLGVNITSQDALEDAWQRSLLPYLLLEWLRHPRPVQEIAELLRQQEGRQNESPESLVREVEAALLVGPCLPEDNPLRLRPRVHRFLRGLARFWRCTNPNCGTLLDEDQTICSECGSRALPLALCRTCGWDFFMSGYAEGDDHRVQPWMARTSTRRTVFLYDPPRQAVQVDPDDEPGDEEEEQDDLFDGQAAVQSAHHGPHDASDRFLCPTCLSLTDENTTSCRRCGSQLQPRTVRVYNNRGTVCPVCRSRFGRYNVLTPITLGNSSALTHVARSLMRELPVDKRRILVFTDSRQDAAHQARFIRGVEQHLKVRRAVYEALRNEPEPHDAQWLIEHVHEIYIQQGFLAPPQSRDERNRNLDKVLGEVFIEFVIGSTVRASLEKLGLVHVGWSGLDQLLSSEAFTAFCRTNHLVEIPTQQAIRHILKLFRQRLAVSHDVFRYRLRRGDRFTSRYGVDPFRQVGLPLAFRLPNQPTVKPRDRYVLQSTWNDRGQPAAAQTLWRIFLGSNATAETLEATLRFLQEHRILVNSRIGQNANDTEGMQVAYTRMLFSNSTSYWRCSVCGHVESNLAGEESCPRRNCNGRIRPWDGPLAENNLNAMLVAADFSPPLLPAEHSAAVKESDRQTAEQLFQLSPPRVNVLACTPTLELGVNIGDLEAVAMRNIPPRPANYAQRAGRTGRQSRMGVITGFARQTPHDGYFFDHPDEIITGAVPPPRFKLENLEAIDRHLSSLALEETRIDFPSNLEMYITEEGDLNEPAVTDLLRRIQDASTSAKTRARQVFAGVPQLAQERIDRTIDGFAPEVRRVLEERAALIRDAVRRMREISNRVSISRREQDAVDGYRQMANKLRSDNKYAYLPRVLAESGLLPGYAFPGDPGSLSVGFDPDPIFASRLQAQREFCPGQVVYARGGRWRVGGIALHRPGSTVRGPGQQRFEFVECSHCKLANPPNNPNCARCNAELPGGNRRAWDVAAFQAVAEDVEPESEEERAFRTFDIRPHLQRDVAAVAFSLGEWRFELRSQESIWWINHGRREFSPETGTSTEPLGFNLCPVCGEHLPHPNQPDPPAEGRRRRNRQPAVAEDPRANQTDHDRRCGNHPEPFAIGHQMRADTLRLVVPGIETTGEDGIAWAWSFTNAILQGALRLFELDEDDLEPMVLTRQTDDGRKYVLEVAWIDRITGGSGILQELIRRFPEVAQASVRHLEGHDCPNSCYRCLRTYRNQRVHGQLNWRLVLPQLQIASMETVTPLPAIPAAAPTTEGPEWDEARREGVGSPLELTLLRAIRSAGLPEPAKQYPINDCRSIADFAYPDRRLLIYVDGMAFHSTLRQRVHDTRQTNCLQRQGHSVLRFLGPQVYRERDRCVEEIQRHLEG